MECTVEGAVWWRRAERQSCDTETLSQLVDASGTPPDSDPFRPDSQLKVEHVSRGTYRLFNKTESHTQSGRHQPFIYFELPREASLLRNSGVYDATTVRDDSTLRADLVRLDGDADTWVLHVAGELLRCPGPSLSMDNFISPHNGSK